MTQLGYLYEIRHRLVRIGLPALVSRGMFALWGFVTIFIIRSLPEDAYAVYAVAKSFEMFGTLLGGGFIHQAILKLASEGDSRREKQLANSGILMSLVFSCIAAALLLAGGGPLQTFYGSLDLGGVYLPIAGVIVSGALCGFPRLLLLTKHRTRDVMVSDVAQFIVRAGIVGVLILTGALTTASQIFTATVIANLVAFCISFALARGLFSPSQGMSRGSLSSVMSFAVITLGTTVANFVYTRTDILMLGKIAPDDVAAYGASRSLTGVILMITHAGNMILLPLVSRMWTSGKRSLVSARVWSTVLIAEVLALPAVAVCVLFPREALDFIYSGKYSDGWPITLVLGALLVVRPLGSFFATASAGVGKPQYSFYGVLISGIVNVGLNAILIPRMGGFGAALATTAAVVLGTVWIVLISTRFIRSNV